jgi:hypothetical protein
METLPTKRLLKRVVSVSVIATSHCLAAAAAFGNSIAQ